MDGLGCAIPFCGCGVRLNRDGAFAVPGLRTGEVAGDGPGECVFIGDKPMFGVGATKDELDFIDALEVVSGGSSGILLSV